MGAFVPMFVFLRETENTQTILTLLDGLSILLQDYNGDDIFLLFFSMRINFRPIHQRIETMVTHQNTKIRRKSSSLLRLLQFPEVNFFLWVFIFLEMPFPLPIIIFLLFISRDDFKFVSSLALIAASIIIY